MYSYLMILMLFLASLQGFESTDLVVGETRYSQLLNHDYVKLVGVPLLKRTQTYFYTDPNHRIIQGLVAKDSLRSQAEPRITAGGVGFEFVNLEFESERGKGLDYDVQIYGYIYV